MNSDLNTLYSYLREVIEWRFKNVNGNFKKEAPNFSLTQANDSPLVQFIKSNSLQPSETITLLAAMVPHLYPNFFLDVVAQEFPDGTDLPLFGGVKAKNHRGIIPTGETIQFLIGGQDVARRIDCLSLFSESHVFYKKDILYLDTIDKGEPLMSGKVLMQNDAFHLLTSGVVPPPKLSTDFPAEKLETELTWDDLVLNDKTMSNIKELEVWLKHNDTFLYEWKMKSRVKAGYRVLFYGPPGTGKTLAAKLLGKYTNKPVYRIDLSTVVSKYIGETEKNLASLFNKATHKDWILFFDEADAIFGKRTSVRDAHDKYANQEVSYLLQRVEDHSGLVILASNFKDNIDDAFTRRFQSIFAFEIPSTKERKLIWEKNLPKKLKLSSELDLDAISKKYELTGSNIMNIIHYCSLQVLNGKGDTLTSEILLKGIKKEYVKEDRLF